MKKHSLNKSVFIDPVCFRAVTRGEKDLFIIYQLRTYYFCTAACRQAFEMEPEKYLDPKISRTKVLWDRYIDKLKKLATHKVF